MYLLSAKHLEPLFPVLVSASQVVLSTPAVEKTKIKDFEQSAQWGTDQRNA